MTKQERIYSRKFNVSLEREREKERNVPEFPAAFSKQFLPYLASAFIIHGA